MRRRMRIKRVNLLPNAITTFGLSCGLFVIFKAFISGIGTYDLLISSVILILVAAFADVLDGTVARAMHAESYFGLMFDSLSDAITFGVTPSILMLRSLSPPSSGPLTFLIIASGMLYSICGVYRLVRFNVLSTQKIDETVKPDVRAMFLGLPIPAAAAATISLNLFAFSPFAHIAPFVRAIMLVVSMFIVGYLMVSKWRFPSPKSIRFRVPTFQHLLAAVIVAIGILYGVLYYFPIFFLVVSWCYVLIGMICTIRIRRKSL